MDNRIDEERFSSEFIYLRCVQISWFWTCRRQIFQYFYSPISMPTIDLSDPYFRNSLAYSV